MAQMTPLVSELLAKALTLSSYERGQLIDHLVASLDNDPPDEGVSEGWDEQIKRRVDDIRLGHVKMIPGERALARLKARLHDAKK
jgi:putative addiction module component (TIGR02574 family)